MTPTDAERIAHYENDLRAYAELTDRQAALLDGVARGLLGDAEKARGVNWSDLPKLAARIKIERDAYFEECNARR